MFGVVLWSDAAENKAVIWCEDHGDLAFYRETGSDGALALDAGDLVRFDMTIDRQYRYAHNPRLVSSGYHPDIADDLMAPVDALEPRRAAQPDRLSAQIIPFRPGAASVPRADQSAVLPV